MSLISDALKKARQDAARHDAGRIDGAPPALPRHMPIRRDPPRAWVPALLGGFAGAALVTAALLWWLRPANAPAESAAVGGATRTAATPAAAVSRPRTADSAAPTPGVPSSATPVSIVPPAGSTATLAEVTLPAALSSEPIPLPASGPTERVRPTPTPRPAAAAAKDGAGAAPERAPGDASPSVAPTAAAPPPTATELPPYRIRLADGRELVLNGIAAGEGVPVALVNRRAVGIGESVDGWQVTRIEPKQVELTRDGERVILSLRR